MTPRLSCIWPHNRDVSWPVDRVGDGLPKIEIAFEEVGRHVHWQVPGAVHRLRPEARSIDTEPVGDLLDVRRRQRTLVELAREDLVIRGLLVEVPLEVES